MPYCAAYKCRSRAKKGVKKTFHKFPSRSPELVKEWVRRSGRGLDWGPSPTAVLCSDHFHERCFDRTGQTTRLRNLALPTIFPFKVSKNGKVLDIPKSGTLSYLARALEIAELPADHMFMKCKDTDTSNSVSTGSTSKPTTLATPATSTPTSASQSKSKKTKTKEFTHDHTYSIVNCPKDMKHKLDIIYNQMDLMSRKLRQAQTNQKRLSVKEKSLLREVKMLRAKQETALQRIEEISDSLHFGL